MKNKHLSQIIKLLIIPVFLFAGCVTTDSNYTYTAAPQQTGTYSSGQSAKNNNAPTPVVMLLIDEKNMGSIPTSEVEAMGMQKLIQNNCKTVDQDMLRANTEQRKRMLKMVGDKRGAAALGSQFGADIVISGSAVCKPGARRISDSNIRTYQAVTTLRSIRTDNGNILATASESGTGLDVEDVRGGSKALRASAEKCFNKLIPQTLNAWQRGAPSSTIPMPYPYHIQITFGGVDKLWKVKTLREDLKARKSLSNVVQRNYTAGAVVFEVDSKIAAEELTEAIVLTPPESLKIQALSIDPGKIVMRVAP